MHALRWVTSLLFLAATPALCAEYHVFLDGCGEDEFFSMCFKPGELTINVGDVVTFHNNLVSRADGWREESGHNVAAYDRSFRCARGCDDQGGDGSPSATAWTFSRRFATPGHFAYQDQAGLTSGVIIVRAAPTFAIAPGITGAWFDPAQDGHGLFLEVLSRNRFLAWWFAFDPADGEQAWFFGVGSYQGATASITQAQRITGGRWIPHFDPARLAIDQWGSLDFTFTDCNHGRVDFNAVAGFGSGSMHLTRLTLPSGLSCR